MQRSTVRSFSVLWLLGAGSVGALPVPQDLDRSTPRLAALTRSMSEEFSAAGNAMREHLQQVALGHPMAAAGAAWRAQQHRARVLHLQRCLAHLTTSRSAFPPELATRDPFDPARVRVERTSLTEGYALTGVAVTEARADGVRPGAQRPWDLYQAHGVTLTERFGAANPAGAERGSGSAHRETVRHWGMYAQSTSSGKSVELALRRETSKSLAALDGPAKPFWAYREPPSSSESQQGVARDAPP